MHLRQAERSLRSAPGSRGGTLMVLRAALARAVVLGAIEGPPASAPGLLEETWFDALARAGIEKRLPPSEIWNAWSDWRGE